MSVVIGSDLSEILRIAERSSEKRLFAAFPASHSLFSMTETPSSLATAALVGLESHLLDRVDAAVIAVDLKGRILFVNRYAEELYGWSPEETIGRSATELAGVALDPEVAAE